MPRAPSFVCVKCEVKKEAEMFEGEIPGAHILYIHRCSALSFLPPHHVTVLIKNMLTHKPCTHLPPPPPSFLLPLYLSQHTRLSLLCRSIIASLALTTLFSSRLLPPSGGLAVLS